MRRRFFLFSAGLVGVLITLIFFAPINSFAQVPSPFCLGNCSKSSFNENVDFANKGRALPSLSVSPINKNIIALPTTFHQQPCRDASSISEPPEHSADSNIEHTKNKNKANDGNGSVKDNQGIIQFILNLINIFLQFLQQLLGMSLTATPVPATITPSPGATVIPTVTLPPCPTNTPVPSSSPTPTLFVPPSLTPSLTPTYSPTVTPSRSPTLFQPSPTPTLITVSPSPVAAANYSGYYFHFATPAVGDTITSVFKAVDVTCGTGFIAPWPGMGDTWEVEHNVAQLGIDIDCSGGSVRYSAWTEALPAGSIYPPNTPIEAGDTIVAAITYQGEGKFTTTIANFDRGWSVDTPMTYASNYVPIGAEVINEEIGGRGVMPFSPIEFTSYLDIGGRSVEMTDQPGLTRLNTTHMQTSDLTGSVFTSTYR